MIRMTSHTLSPPAAAPAPAPGRRTIDAPTRMFHWLFALSFVGAYLSAESEHWRLLHVTLGYTMAGLLAFRLLYGLFGPQPVRLSVLWRKLTAVAGWTRGLLQGKVFSMAHWRQGQGVAMGAAVVVMLALVVPVTLSGYALYNDWGGEWFEDVHEFFANFFLVMVFAHLALLAGLSFLRRRNLAWPMVTGRIEGKGPDVIRRNRAWLAALLLLAVLAFGAWQWQQGPAGGAPDRASARFEHDDD